MRQEIETNVALGAAVSARVEQLAQPAEADKYATYVEQIGTITSLLLGLSGRLARAENALVSLGEQDADERVSGADVTGEGGEGRGVCPLSPLSSLVPD